MSVESHAISHATHYSETTVNAYFGTEPDLSLPRRHPLNVFIERSSGFTPGDAFPSGSPTKAIYQWPPLLAFIAGRSQGCTATPTRWHVSQSTS